MGDPGRDIGETGDRRNMLLVQSPSTAQQLSLHRNLLLFAGGAYLVWWVFVELALPGAFNPLPGRLLAVACFGLALAASYVWRAVAERLPDVLAVCCAIATAHYFYLIERNHAEINWIVGCYITITAVCAILQTARSLLLYSVFVAAISVVLLVREPLLSFVVFMPGTLTILMFANMGLRSRLALLAELQDSHHRVESDVAARKHAEAALLLANRELEAFSYSVAHDLRAPLRGIDGYSQVLVEDFSEPLGELGRSYLDKVRADAQRMGQLIDDLLGLAKVSRVELARQRLDLSGAALQVVEALRCHDPDRQVRCSIQDGIFVDADPRLLRVLLENLLGNAWKFTAKTPAAEIEISTATRADATVVSVRDNGAGFDMAFASKLFAPFQRLHTTEEFPGTGIGLATVQRIVQRHGGRIWVESTVDQGATFHLTLDSSRQLGTDPGLVS